MHSPSFAPSAISLCQNQSHDPKLPRKSWALALRATHIPLHVHPWLSPQASASVPALHKAVKAVQNTPKTLETGFLPGDCSADQLPSDVHARKAKQLPLSDSSLPLGTPENEKRFHGKARVCSQEGIQQLLLQGTSRDCM